MNNILKYNCIFGGGGIRGMCYIGAVKALKEYGIQINSIAGSSVGAVFASLLAVGYNEDEIQELFYDFNLTMFRDINLTLFVTDISLSKGEIFLEWLREKIEQKFYKNNYKKNGNKPVRFKDIKNDLHILTVDINTNTPFVFSKESTPDEEIAFAVRASASLPGLMKPVSYGNSLLIDGDMIKSWPAWNVFTSLDSDNTRVLEFRLEGSRKSNDIKNPIDYLNSIINIVWYFSTENVYNLYQQNDRYDFVVIDTKEIILFDFNIDKKIKDELIAKGYNDTKNYIINVLPKKKRILAEKYKYIVEKLKILNIYIESSNYEKAVNNINEILSNINEMYNYIDKYIYREIKDLKNILYLNEKKTLIFTNKINNKKQIKEQNNILIQNIEARIEELNSYNMNFSNKI